MHTKDHDECSNCEKLDSIYKYHREILDEQEELFEELEKIERHRSAVNNRLIELFFEQNSHRFTANEMGVSYVAKVHHYSQLMNDFLGLDETWSECCMRHLENRRDNN